MSAISVPLTVGALEALLFEAFPASDCMDWDNCGLLVGNPALEVTGICLALDPTPEAIALTALSGANVLITHHPIMLDPLDHVVYSGDFEQGIVVQAIEDGVALIALHTCLDRASAAQSVLSDIMGLIYESPLENREGEGGRMGQVARLKEPMLLEDFAHTVEDGFGVTVRAWGDPVRSIERVAIATGSGTSLIPDALEAGADVFVAGEIKYHAALGAVAQGMCCIEIGHDISENPLMGVVENALGEIDGLKSVAITRFDPPRNWWTPSRQG